jgi:hypothetical protein
VYSHSLAFSVAHDEHLSVEVIRRIARREWSLIEAAAPPVVALLLGALGILSARASTWSALIVGLLVLGAQGIAFSHVERLGRLATLLVVAANLSLGVLLIGLKLLVTH